MLIYFVKNRDNQIVYIGQTRQQLVNRKGCFWYQARKGRGALLGAAIRKHGEDAFHFEAYEVVENQIEANNEEKRLIAIHKPKYNQKPGGQGEYKCHKDRPKTNQCGKRTLESCRRIKVAARNRRIKPFICHQNDKIYASPVFASEDLGFFQRKDRANLSNVLNGGGLSFHGFTFEFLAQDKSSLIKLETPTGATDCKGNASSNELSEKTLLKRDAIV